MANQEHLDILKQGVEVWNQWRKKHRDIQPDLREANLNHEVGFAEIPFDWDDLDWRELTQTDLSGVDFGWADLYGANLNEVNLYRGDLSGTDLRTAQLRWANLSEVDLRGADLTGAILYGAHLNQADLSQADLSQANLKGAYLSGANLKGVRMSSTILVDVDLSLVRGLDAVTHKGPSSIGIDTIILSSGKIPGSFLRMVGVPGSIIEAIPSLIGSLNPIDFYSCFISYASKDQTFAERLHADLQKKGVRCWFAPEDLKIGEKFWHRIDESIKLYDKLLVVLSQHSVESEWVEREVMAALEKERQQRRPVLFPITLDEAFKQTSAPWAADLRRQRHIGDFTHWKNLDDYQKAFNRLLRDLKAEA